MKIVSTIEARMASSRLPGKMLMPVLGLPILGYLINRLKSVPSLDEIVVATTTNEEDDVLAEVAGNAGISCFRGSEWDVMSRVLEAGASVQADLIVEITGDCPIIDPDLVEQTIQIFLHNDVDYVSNSIIRSYPDGMDCQVFPLDTLLHAAAITSDPLDREHVNLYMSRHPEKYSLLHVIAPPSLHWPDLGLTLDEISDYKLIKKIIEYFESENSRFRCSDVIKLLRENPALVNINRHVNRKGVQ